MRINKRFNIFEISMTFSERNIFDLLYNSKNLLYKIAFYTWSCESRRWVEKTLYSRSSKRKVKIDPCIYCRGVTCDSPVDPDFPDMCSVRSLRFPSNLCYSLNYLLAYQYLREWTVTFLNASIPSSTPLEIYQI